MSMSVSLKKATNKTNIKHNNRTMSDRKKERNSHIDHERSDENKYLVHEDIRDLYEREFGEALKKYNEKKRDPIEKSTVIIGILSPVKKHPPNKK